MVRIHSDSFQQQHIWVITRFLVDVHTAAITLQQTILQEPSRHFFHYSDLQLYMLRTTSVLKDKTQTTQSQNRFSTLPAYQDFPSQTTLPANRIPPSNQLNQYIRISQGSSLSSPSSTTSTKIRSPLLNDNALAQFPSSEFPYNGISPSKRTIFASCTSKLFFTINISNVGVNSGNNSLVYQVCSVPLVESPKKKVIRLKSPRS